MKFGMFDQSEQPGNLDSSALYKSRIANQSIEQFRAELQPGVGGGLVDYTVGVFAFGDLSHDEAMRSLDLYCEHVVAPLNALEPLR